MHCDYDDHQHKCNYFRPEWPRAIKLGAEENKAFAYNPVEATRSNRYYGYITAFWIEVYKNGCNALTAAW